MKQLIIAFMVSLFLTIFIYLAIEFSSYIILLMKLNYHSGLFVISLTIFLTSIIYPLIGR